MSAKPARESILEAAESIVAEQGANFMTMDAVAAKAGVSKGGLIYHFPSQDDLLKAMMQRFTQRVDARREEIRAGLPNEAARDVVAHILTWSNLCTRARRTASALLAAITRAPALVEPAQAAYKVALEPVLKSPGNPDRMAILAMAADGIWLMELLGMQPFTEAELVRIKAELVKVAREWCVADGSPANEQKPHPGN